MITEDYVSFETAKLLKEKGFDGWCDHFYDFYPETGKVQICGCDEHNNSRYEDEYSMPTLNVACKWLRETYHLHILFEISDPSQINPKYHFIVWDTSTQNSYIVDLFDSYEEACEEAIKYCLEHLI